MDAGSSFDTDLVLTELPTVLTGVVALTVLKAVTLFAATKVPRWMEPNRLPEVDAARLALLLAGGGEFAFVVLALAEKLKVLPTELGGVLTAIVLITMSTTPILGDLAMGLTNSMEEGIDGLAMLAEKAGLPVASTSSETQLADDAIVVCGYGEIGQSVLRVLGADYVFRSDIKHNDASMLPKVVAFDNDPSLINEEIMSAKAQNGVVALFGDGSNPAVIRSSGVTMPIAIYVAYEDHYKSLSATARLRASFATTPIFGRAQSSSQARSLKAAGATEVVTECDELSQTAVSLLRRSGCMATSSTKEDGLRLAMAEAAGISPQEVDDLMELFTCIDRDGNGLIEAGQIVESLRRSNSGIVSDDEFASMEAWTLNAVQAPIPAIEFCRLYLQAPETIQRSLTDSCMI
jgi:Trk K+ transport system NAD-binding subunit